MGYYIRVLGTTDPNIHIDELISGLTNEGLTAEFDIDQNECAENWTVIGVSNSNGDDLIQIERNPVKDAYSGQTDPLFRQIDPLVFRGCLGWSKNVL